MDESPDVEFKRIDDIGCLRAHDISALQYKIMLFFQPVLLCVTETRIYSNHTSENMTVLKATACT